MTASPPPPPPNVPPPPPDVPPPYQQEQPPAPTWGQPPPPPDKSRRNLIIGILVGVVVVLLLFAALLRPGGTPGPTLPLASPTASAAPSDAEEEPTDEPTDEPQPDEPTDEPQPDEPTEKPPEEAPATDEEADGPPSAYSVGDEVDLDDQIHTVSEAEWWTSDSQFIKPNEGNALQTWLVAIEGTGAGASYNPFFYRVRAPDGFEHRTKFGRTPGLGGSTNLAQGERVQGWLTFEVPAAGGRHELIYTPGIVGEPITIKADFKDPG